MFVAVPATFRFPFRRVGPFDRFPFSRLAAIFAAELVFLWSPFDGWDDSSAAEVVCSPFVVIA
jgi:hypothetical protein